MDLSTIFWFNFTTSLRAFAILVMFVPIFWDFKRFLWISLRFSSSVGAKFSFNFLRSVQASLLSPASPPYCHHCVPYLFPKSLSFARKNLLITEKSSLSPSASPPPASHAPSLLGPCLLLHLSSGDSLSWTTSPPPPLSLSWPLCGRPYLSLASLWCPPAAINPCVVPSGSLQGTHRARETIAKDPGRHPHPHPDLVGHLTA